jgi:hypothetical protein
MVLFTRLRPRINSRSSTPPAANINTSSSLDGLEEASDQATMSGFSFQPQAQTAKNGRVWQLKVEICDRICMSTDNDEQHMEHGGSRENCGGLGIPFL